MKNLIYVGFAIAGVVATFGANDALAKRAPVKTNVGTLTGCQSNADCPISQGYQCKTTAYTSTGSAIMMCVNNYGAFMPWVGYN